MTLCAFKFILERRWLESYVSRQGYGSQKRFQLTNLTHQMQK